jgi:hypothetical protein
VQAVAVHHAYDAGLADRDVQVAQRRVVHHHVRFTRQQDGPQDGAAVAVQHHQGAAVGRAEQPLAVQPQPVRACHPERQ